MPPPETASEPTALEPTASGWSYQPNAGFYDEMIGPGAHLRPHWAGLMDAIEGMGAEGLANRWREGRKLLYDNGVTYNVYGDPRSTDRPWPLDPIPLAIDEKEWAGIEDAMRQRATLLNALLADIYGPQRLLHEDLFPAEIVFRHPGFLRPCCNVSVPDNIYLHNYSADLARSPDGHWWVIADRTQAPSGAGYALENRLVSQRVLPDVFRASHVRRLADYFISYRKMLRGLVPHNRDNPRIVLLTPGPYNETYFEHAFLARYLGYTLVEGGDLTVRDNRVYLKTLGGLLPVDLILRRQDDSFCDPLELRADSLLGVPGLVQAVRLGNVTVTNALGSGLLESAATEAFLPGLCRHLLGEDLKMPTVATWWCGGEEPLEYVTENIDRLVIKQAFRTGRAPAFGARLSKAEREKLLEEIRHSPADFVAQEQVALSTVPAWESGDRLTPRHLVLRVFVTASKGSYAVMPGGLTRITSSLDSLVASMQHGGGSKDTWVFSSAPVPQTTLLTSASASLEVNRATFELPSRVADNLFWLGRYVERVESAVRIARAILTRMYQESDPVSIAGLEAGVRIMTALGHLPSRVEVNGNGKSGIGAKGGNGVKSEQLQKAEQRSTSEQSAKSAPLAKPDPIAKPEQRENALEREMLAMIYDSEEKTSLGWTLHQLRRVAWLLRDRFSADAWRILNRFDQQFAKRPEDEPLPIATALNLLDDAIMTLSAFSGLVMESMTRGDGWRFLDLGRRLERALQMVEMLRHGLSPHSPDEGGELQSLLEIADSTLTYRSRYLTSMQADLVLDLLLLDEVNPRSAAFQLARLREHVEELPRRSPNSRKSAEWKTAVRMLTAVQLANAAELMQRAGEDGERGSFENLLEGIAAGLRTLSEAVARDYFDHTITSRQLSAT
jgi:uncharacterized circularly permuted ATP-grasp superfamily protein/uncharacterized alpha-E superfamily protein